MAVETDNQSRTMKRFPVHIGTPVVAATVLGLALLGSGGAAVSRASEHGDHGRSWVLVPFAGTVTGELQLQLLPDGGMALLAAPPAAVRASHIGNGVQLYDAAGMVVEPVVDPNVGVVGMSVSGMAATVAANGDLMNITFELNGLFVTPTQLEYTGRYTVLPGGTGRFEYEDAALDADLGSGLIQGEATLQVDPTTGEAVLSFAHEFAGDLAVEKSGKHGHKKPKSQHGKKRVGED